MLRYLSTLAHFAKLSILSLAFCASSCVWQSLLFGVEAAAVRQDMLGDNYKELWRGYANEGWPKGWKVEDGVLSRVGGGGDIMTKDKYADFELNLEWKISKDGNSGILYRVRTGDDAPYYSGPEYQVLDNDGHQDGKNMSTSSGALYALYAPEEDFTKPVGQWNQARIVVKDNHVEHWLNGHRTAEAHLGSDEWNERVANSKFKDWEQFGKTAEGHIALQDHGNPVWYRNISVRSLEDAPEAPRAQENETEVSVASSASSACCACKCKCCTCQKAKRKGRHFKRCKK